VCGSCCCALYVSLTGSKGEVGGFVNVFSSCGALLHARKWAVMVMLEHKGLLRCTSITMLDHRGLLGMYEEVVFLV